MHSTPLKQWYNGFSTFNAFGKLKFNFEKYHLLFYDQIPYHFRIDFSSLFITFSVSILTLFFASFGIKKLWLWHPFWHHFGSLLVYFSLLFGVDFCTDFWIPFWSLWAPLGLLFRLLHTNVSQTVALCALWVRGLFSVSARSAFGLFWDPFCINLGCLQSFFILYFGVFFLVTRLKM